MRGSRDSSARRARGTRRARAGRAQGARAFLWDRAHVRIPRLEQVAHARQIVRQHALERDHRSLLLSGAVGVRLPAGRRQQAARAMARAPCPATTRRAPRSCQGVLPPGGSVSSQRLVQLFGVNGATAVGVDLFEEHIDVAFLEGDLQCGQRLLQLRQIDRVVVIHLAGSGAWGGRHQRRVGSTENGQRRKTVEVRSRVVFAG